jgi:porin
MRPLLRDLNQPQKRLEFAASVERAFTDPDDLAATIPGGAWYLGASFKQYLVQNPNNPQEGWGVFGQFGFSDGNPNPIEWSAILGVGGMSFLPDRNLDRWGVGYFRYSLSSDLEAGLASVGVDLRDEQGIEAFYTGAVTPWVSVSGDLQLVEPILADADTAVTASLRAKIKF